MVSNILRALWNIKSFSGNDLSNVYVISKSKKSAINRANSMGEALEYFMKDAFCNTFSEKDAKKKILAYSDNFSYLGNQNNPPDAIIKDGDAIEVKKIDGVKNTDLALNSSYPKSKLYSTSTLITKACRECELGWTEKDIVYAVGFIDDEVLKVLTLVYGDCYAASPAVYEGVKDMVSVGITKMDLEFSQTRELGRINRVDPLGITNLRIRGMWTIQNPLKVFEDVFELNKNEFGFIVVTLMRKEKFNSFPKEDRDKLEKSKEFGIRDVKIRDPDNPAKLLDAKLIAYYRK